MEKNCTRASDMVAAPSGIEGPGLFPVAVSIDITRSSGRRWSRHARDDIDTLPSISTFFPSDLGDVGRQVTQSLLAALDRVVLLDGLVAQLPGGEDRAHLDAGRCAVGR